MKYSTDYEKLFFLNSLKNPKYFKVFYDGFFTNEEIDILANISKKFYDEFKDVPSKEQLKLLVEKSDAHKKVSKDIIDIVFETDLNEYDNDWLKQISESWIKWRNFDKQLIRLLEYVKMQNITPDTVDSIISKSIGMISEKGTVSFDSDLGLNFFDTSSHKQKTHKKLTSSYNFIDRITGGGYDSKTLIAYVGEQGIGKCFSGSTKIKIRNKKTGEIVETLIEDFIYKIKSNA